MKETKDLFSTQAETYARYRPVYPQMLYDFLFSVTFGYNTAWDCGTGNGQVASVLADKFEKVYATDISEQQLSHAVKKPNIQYMVSRAEQTELPDNCADLITVGTAIHWFDFAAFYEEARRVGKKGSVLAAWAYAPFRCNAAINRLVDHFYWNTVGPYWPPERKYGDDAYRSIPFPFEEIHVPPMHIDVHWTLDQFMGYLYSWSSVQNYIKANGNNPLDLLLPELSKAWGDAGARDLVFPLFLRAGRIQD
jgi:SAM-dependent methyltransferase